jgi:hypothetical protein
MPALTALTHRRRYALPNARDDVAIIRPDVAALRVLAHSD